MALLIVIYLAFISLGLPDALLGSAWPSMYMEMNASIQAAGTLAMLISGGTIVSSLLSGRLLERFGAGKITAFSVGLSALTLFGFATADSYVALIGWCIPYGLAAGAVDAALNHYAAVHFKARHVQWLHCMWGVGAGLSPLWMGWCIRTSVWQNGYRLIGLLQIVLTGVVLWALPLFQKEPAEEQAETASPSMPEVKKSVWRNSTALAFMLSFLAYCSLEQTAGLWASSWLVITKGLDKAAAATAASLFYLGIMIGRATAGYVAERIRDEVLIRLGEGLILAGLLLLFLPWGRAAAFIGLALTGIGCAPIYPSLIHLTPMRVGAAQSKTLIGLEMASAYIGSMFAPRLFAAASRFMGLSFYPLYLGILGLFLSAMTVKVVRKKRSAREEKKRLS